MTVLKVENFKELFLLNNKLKKEYLKVSEILETDISFSFRVYTDSGEKTIYFYEVKKQKFVYTKEMKKADKEAEIFYNNHLNFLKCKEK